MPATIDRRVAEYRRIRADGARTGMHGRASYQWRMAEAEVALQDAEAEGRIRFRWEPDYDYNPFDMTDQDDLARLEERRLQSGQYAAYSARAEVQCPCCEHWDEKASLWGIVLAEWGEGAEFTAAYRREVEQDLAVEAGAVQ